MGALRERITKRNKAREDADVVDRFQKKFDNQADWLERVDDKRELVPCELRGGTLTRMAKHRLKHHLAVYAQSMSVATKPKKVTGGTDIAEELFDFYKEVIDSPDLFPDSEHEGESAEHQWQRERFEDIRDNFIYLNWLEQVGKGRYRDLCVHFDYLGIRSALTLVTETPDGIELLGSWTPAGMHLPDRNEAIAFLESRGAGVKDPEHYIENAIRAVPGIYSAGHTLLGAYSDVVKIEREAMQRGKISYEDTPLPTDAALIAEVDCNLRELSLEDRRMEIAVIAYTVGTGNVKEIPKLYGVSERAFIRELRERELLKPKGGDTMRYRKKGVS